MRVSLQLVICNDEAMKNCHSSNITYTRGESPYELVPGKPWSLFQLQHALRLRVMTSQVVHNVKATRAETRDAA
jgi:hypothetical protein